MIAWTKQHPANTAQCVVNAAGLWLDDKTR